ncbi:MAG: 16S rRNA (cytidine(1402)-2'-O)-methyltransferase [Chloroflexi bacterium]|nr:MAG: 16S rRNA (cytidine(1402)-2'-O)-methyltransferase [Chloroflexota bacterium]
MSDPRGGGATPGALHIVATPIGNLADLSPRAIAVLREVRAVIAEDSRVARVLLSSIDVTGELIALPGFDEVGRIAPLIERLKRGDALALISDAGTPLISDPGQHLVRAAIAAGIRVIPIPGASALLAALVASGVAGARWSFEGFLPRSGVDRRRVLGAIAADDRATVVYEAGGRVLETLRDLASVCGGTRSVALCRELTKLHEEVRRGSLEEVTSAVERGEVDGRGEFVIVLGETSEVADSADAGGAYPAALAAVEERVASGASRSDAVRSIASEWGLERRRLWAAAHEDATEGGEPLGRVDD